MSNRLITVRDLVDEMFEEARRKAESIPLDLCARIATSLDRTPKILFGPRSAVSVTLVRACWERMERQPGLPEGAD